MSYQVYEDWNAPRWAGYGVPAECDWTTCDEEIDRGLSYKCEEHGEYDEEEAGEGCGRFFCEAHRYSTDQHLDMSVAKPDTPQWRAWMLTDESWEQWRTENPALVSEMKHDPQVMLWRALHPEDGTLQ